MPAISRQLQIDYDRAPRRCLFGLWAGIRLDLLRYRDIQKWAGLYELETHRFYRRFIRPGMTVYDVGAADGDTSLLFAKLVGPKGLVLAFEPDELHYRQRWTTNLGLNRILAPRITLCTEGVRSLTGQADFVKIDVDGPETEILWNSRDDGFFEKSRPAFLVETHSHELETVVLSIFHDVGYETCVVRRAWWRHGPFKEGRPDDNHWIEAWSR